MVETAPDLGGDASASASRGIRVTVNGLSLECPAGLSITQLLDHLTLPAGRVAVERNGRIVGREARDTVQALPGDAFEIVTFVGGG